METEIRLLLSRDDPLHKRGYYVVAEALRDAGLEVIMGDWMTPRQIAKIALDEDVDIIGYRIMQGSPKVLVPFLFDRLKENGIDDVPVVIGGIIPKKEVPLLKDLGVKEVFHPHTPLEDIQRRVLEIGKEHRSKTT